MEIIKQQKNIINIDIKNDLFLTKKVINKTVSKSTSEGECHLSFYSVAKNIRFLSSYFYKSIKEGKKPIISNNPRPGEDFFWRQNTGNSWFPWLWSRYKKENLDNFSAWNNYFNSFNFSHLDDVEINEVNDFYLYLSSIDYVFNLKSEFVESMDNKYKTFQWPNEPVIGLQIRRGEIVTNDGDINKSWNSRTGLQHGSRPIFSIEDYMDGLKSINETYGYKYIYVSTDSSETIDFLVKNYPEYTFLYNNYERTKFLRYDGNPNKVALEFDIEKHPELTELYTESCLMDLYYLSNCKMYVGGMSHSEYGICGWFLQMVKQQSITPFYNVEGRFNVENTNIGLLLL